MRSNVFIIWNIDPKDKCIHKNKHHIHISIENMFVIVELFLTEGAKGKENNRKSTIHLSST
jgi:hypothetical protein